MEQIINDPEIMKNFITSNWAYCFNTNCQYADSCFRQLSVKYKPNTADCGRAVYPDACKDGKCRHYVRLGKATVAWGFDGMYNDVKWADLQDLREDVKHLLGGKTAYYRYHRGDKKLSPSQQENIRRLFLKYGYERVEFAHTEERVMLLG